MCFSALKVLKQCAPLQAPVRWRCVLVSRPLLPRWRAFPDRNLQGHHSWLCGCCCWTFPSSVLRCHTYPSKETVVVIGQDATEKMRSGQGGGQKKKEQLEQEATQSVCVLCAQKVSTQKTPERQRPEGSSCQAAAELHAALPQIQHFVRGCEEVCRRLHCFVYAEAVCMDWLSFLCLQLNGV